MKVRVEQVVVSWGFEQARGLFSERDRVVDPRGDEGVVEALEANCFQDAIHVVEIEALGGVVHSIYISILCY